MNGRAWFPRLLIAVVCLFVGSLLLLNGPDRIKETDVAVDGRSHTVDVTPFTATALRAERGAAVPDCAVNEPGVRQSLPLGPPSRSAARTGDYLAFRVFTPSTSSIEITCSGTTDVVKVALETAGTPYRVARYGGAGVLLLLGLGLLVQLATWAVRERRVRE